MRFCTLMFAFTLTSQSAMAGDLGQALDYIGENVNAQAIDDEVVEEAELDPEENADGKRRCRQEGEAFVPLRKRR